MMTLFYSKTFTPESRLVKAVESRLSYQSEAQTHFHLGSAVENVCNVFSGGGRFCKPQRTGSARSPKVVHSTGKASIASAPEGTTMEGSMNRKELPTAQFCAALHPLQAKGTEKVPLCCGNGLREEATSGPRMALDGEGPKQDLEKAQNGSHRLETTKNESGQLMGDVEA
jgi:hypothetical protein